MAGLLDFLNDPDAKLGLALLAAGGPQAQPMSFGQRVSGAMQSVSADQQAALRNKLLQSQVDENASQNEIRKQQMALAIQKQNGLANFFGGGLPSPAASVAGAPAGGAPVGSPVAGPGSAAPEAGPSGLQLKGMPVEKVAQLKAMYGIDLMDQWKAANVPTQFSAGSYTQIPGQAPSYLADPTKGVGFENGRISMLPGAGNLAMLEGQKAAAQGLSKTVKVWNPNAQRYDYANETTAAGGGFAAEPSAPEAASNAAAQTRAVNTAGADVVRDTAKQGAAKLAGQMGAGVDRALDLLKQGPTASGAGAMMDNTAGFFGKSTKGADLSSQLETLSGWLTANVPRMEGPQSDKDVANYRIMAGAVGDRTKPVSQRIAAAEELKALQAKYSALNGIEPQGSWGDPAPAKTSSAEQPKSAFVKIDGKNLPARRAPDGNLYVQQPNGKYARVVE